MQTLSCKTQLTWVENHLSRDLGDGLVLRFATPADAEPLAQFNGSLHGRDRFNEFVAAYTRDIMSEAHPTCGPSNVTLVKDTQTDQIVSTMCLIPQTWTYAGIPFEVGRPEIVGTDPAFRRRGLVRAQFELLHAKSAAMGHHVQCITGIPWYYRQFGYEYALDLDGGRMVYLVNVPALKEGESELYRLRAMTMDDLPFVKPLYERECARSLVACPRPDWLWQCLLVGYSRNSPEARPYQIIETADGRAVGYVAPDRDLMWNAYGIIELAVIEGQSLRAAMPSVMRALKVMAVAEAAAQNKSVSTLYYKLGREHPVFDAVPDLFQKTPLPYGWYIRVADVPAFLRHIAPALEARLARSPLSGHTGEIKINEYTSGFRLVWEQGKIVTIEPWTPADNQDGHAAFPPLVFLRMLFGHRSLAELRAFYPDCWAEDEADALLNALFPRANSQVIGVG
jgi:hypothetical protein